MRNRVVVAVLLSLLAAGGLLWIVFLGNADVSVENAGNPTIRCDSIVHPPDLSSGDGEYSLDDAVRRTDRDRTYGSDGLPVFVDACGRVRTERLWTSVLVAIPTTLLLAAAGFAVREAGREARARPRPPARPRRNKQPQL